jgi:leader peptidase (prepilin peptidase)/N-methyltransferase
MILAVFACFGSFANVLIYRLPRNKSIVAPRSFCPACKQQIFWYDNVPVMSWLLLRGKCRQCSSKIPIRYFLVEWLGIICAAVAFYRFGFSLPGLTCALFLLWVAIVAIIDWEHMIIPHTLTVSGMVTGLILSMFNGVGLYSALLGLGVGAGCVLALSYAYRLVRGTIGMGGGDVMLMGMIGAFVGPWSTVVVLFGGALFGSLFALVHGRGKLGGSSKLPFGTFLALSAIVVFLAGEAISHWYLEILTG